MEITWLGHSSFYLELTSGEVIVFDPWVAENPKFPKDFKFDKIDYLLLSHGHSDHTGDAVKLAKKFKPKVVAIYELGLWLEKEGVGDVHAMNKGGTQKLGSLEITMTHAFHSSSVMDGKDIVYTGEPCGYVVKLPDARRIYFAGDTAVFGDMALIRELYAPELAFLPIGSLFTMGPHEAAKAVELLGVKQVVPMHHGTFPKLTGTPDEFKAKVPAGVSVRTMNPGETIRW